MDKVFVQVINLDDSTERMSHAAAQFSAAGLPFQRCSGVDGRGRSWVSFLPGYIPFLNYIWFGRYLTGGELGCFLSHRRAARAFLKSGAPYGLIFEDDLVLDDEFVPDVTALIERLEGGACRGWRVINLGKVPRKLEAFTAPVFDLDPLGRQTLLDCFDFPLTAHGLLWSRAGARDFLIRSSLVLGTVDNWLRSDLAIFGGGYCLSRPIVLQRRQESVICSEPGAQILRQAGRKKEGWWAKRSQARARARRFWGGKRRQRQGLT